MVTIKKDFNLRFNPKTIMHLIDCSEDSPVYSEMLEEFYDLSEKSIAHIKPIALMSYGEIPEAIRDELLPEGCKALFCLISVGNELSRLSTSAFDKGDCVAGLMYDAMADDMLFQIDGILKQDAVEFCKKENMGILKRLEAPTDIEMEFQKLIWEKTDANKIAGINIKSSFMFDPVKTIAHIYLLDEGCKSMNIHSNCEGCASHDTCKLKKCEPKKVTVLSQKSSKDIILKENQSLLDALIENELYVPAICGGRGTCGKCGIILQKGSIPISDEDNKFFSKDELASGMRLSCKAYPDTDCVISLNQDEDDFEVLTDYSGSDNSNSVDDYGSSSQKVVVDIGTTTIAMQRIDSITGQVYQTYSAINKQRAYGADVISRIQASNDGKSEELKKTIREELQAGLKTLIKKDSKIQHIFLAGNTTMVHLFMGYSCKTLGQFPFNAYNLNTIDTEFRNLPLTILPGISTFVGADITSGILACDIGEDEKTSMLIDIGTNGEMAIGNKNRILVASTAAGPAFEGGNISCGTGSIKGAVCGVEMSDGLLTTINTIGDSEPVGICGTGVIEIVSELLENNLIDETGRLNDEYFDDGFFIAFSKDNQKLCLTQKDIREVQLAKSAIRAGIETLILRYGISYNEIDTIYLAGGFGYKMNIEKAIKIGMLPEEFRNKIVSVGNSSLNGCVKYATDITLRGKAEEICKRAIEISLSDDKAFNSLYAQHMLFNNMIIEEE